MEFKAICIVLLALFFAGCVDISTPGDKPLPVRDGPICGNHQCEPGESRQACPQDCSLINELGNVCGNNTCEAGETVAGCPQDCAENNTNLGGSPPFVSSTRVSPTNASLGNTIAIEIDVQDDAGVTQVVWKATKPFEEGSRGVLECGQATCSLSWQLTPIEQGSSTLTIYALDLFGQESDKSVFNLNIGPAWKATPRCGNGTCEATETNANCSSDCGPIAPMCGNGTCEDGETNATCGSDCAATIDDDDSCTFNSDCGYKQVCSGGLCRDVQCTNDGQCGSGKECESNRCVSCPSGPFGPAC